MTRNERRQRRDEILAVASICGLALLRLNTDAFFRVLVASGIVLSKKGYRADE